MVTEPGIKVDHPSFSQWVVRLSEGMLHLVPLCLLLPVLVSSNFLYPSRVDPLSSYSSPPLQPVVVVSTPSLLDSSPDQQLLDEPSFHEYANILA